MNGRRWLLILLAAMLMAACAAPPAPTPTPTPEPMATPVPPPTLAPTQALPPTALPTLPLPLPTMPSGAPPGGCTPQVTANSIINVRNGPGMIYSIIGSLEQGATATVDGKNAEGTWWQILYTSAPNGHGWVAGSVTTSNCIPPTLAVIPASSFPVPFMAAVIDVSVGVDPGEIDVPGCVGEAQKITANATISASGPMTVTYYFEIDGVGTTKTRTLTFNAYGPMQVSETFRPAVEEGNHWVRLWIEGLDLSGWNNRVRYRINCP